MIRRDIKDYLHNWWNTTKHYRKPSLLLAEYAGEFINSLCNCEEWHDEDD